MTIDELEKGQIVYYARKADNELYECTVRTVYPGESVIVCDNDGRTAHLVSAKEVPSSLFPSRGLALDKIKERMGRLDD